jgi:prepilin-type N-terminal cleavage/methylation domain-containing protein
MRRIGLHALRSERGVSLPELLVCVIMGAILILAALSLLQEVNRSSARTAARVDANQQARPVMERLMDELRSTCVTRGVVPILGGTGGSSPTSISFLHQTGSGVTLVPDKRTITLASGTLTETVYPASPTTPNSAGVWTFSSTASSTRQMLKNVALATVNGTANTPLFQYYTYVNGVITALPASPNLSATDAARTVQVVVSFAASPSSNPTGDVNAPVSVTDTALLRFGPPSELSTGTNLPCT